MKTNKEVQKLFDKVVPDSLKEQFSMARERERMYMNNWMKKFYYKNRNRLLAKCKKYARDNKEKINAKGRERYAENPEKFREKSKNFYLKNKKKILAKAKKKRREI